MRRIALLSVALVLAAGCKEPTQPDRENVANQPSFDGDDAEVVQVAPPTGKPGEDVASIEAAVAAATPGAVIQFGRGKYALEPTTQINVSVPEVTLQGHSRGTTILGFFDPEFMVIHFVLNGGAQTVRGLTFEGFPLALLFEEPGTPTGGYRLEDCTFRNGDLPFFFNGSSDNVSTVRGNEFINVTLPFVILGKTVHFRGNSVTSPNLKRHPLGRPFNAGVLAPDGGTCQNHVLEENTVVGNADGFILVDCQNNVIRKNTFVDQRVFVNPDGTTGDNGTMVWAVGPGVERNLIEDNVLRGSEGLGIVVEEGRRNRIVGNKFFDLPGERPTFTPFPGTAIFLGEPTRANEVFENEFENVVNTIVDLGRGNRIGPGQDNGSFAVASTPRLSLSAKGSRTLDHPKLRVVRERLKN